MDLLERKGAMRSVRLFTLVLGLFPCGMWSQMDALERFLEEQVVLGDWDPHEAASVIHHIASFGQPVVPQEAGAIQGLRPSSISALEAEISWISLCTGVLGQAESKRSRLTGSWTARVVAPRFNEVLENRSRHSIRMKKQGHWALRLDRGLESNRLEHVSGHLIFKNLRKKSTIVVGDHVLRWGMGLNVWDQSPFAGLNEAVSVLPAAHWLTPSWGALASQHRSGVARTGELGSWRLASSISMAGHVMMDAPTEPVQWRNTSWFEARSVEGLSRIRELRLSQLIRRQLDWGSLGVVAEGGAFLQIDSLKENFGWFGFHAEGHWNNVRWAAETRHFDAEHALRLTCLKNLGVHWDVYGSLEHQQNAHPAWRWNDAKSGEGTRFIWGGQKLESAQSKWSGTWRAETWGSGDDRDKRTMRIRCKALLCSSESTQIQLRFQWQAESDHHGWMSPTWRQGVRLQREQSGLKIRCQASMTSGTGSLSGLGLGVSFWLEGKQTLWRWKVAASSWRVQEGDQLYGAEPTMQGVGTQIMTGTGSRLSWWWGYELSRAVSFHWVGHAIVRSDRLSNSSGGFSTEGPVQTAMDFRLTVSL